MTATQFGAPFTERDLETVPDDGRLAEDTVIQPDVLVCRHEDLTSAGGAEHGREARGAMVIVRGDGQ